MNNLLYFILGLFVGVLGFWIVVTQYPNVLNNQPVVEEPSWRLKSIETDLPPGEAGATIKYGYILLTKTAEHIGPLAKSEKMRFAGNNLTCNNCHLRGGTKIGSGPFVGVYDRFPQFRGRENKMGTLEERINGCMERSMNGKKMPEDSPEMQAMIAYIKWIGEEVPAEQAERYKGYLPIRIPNAKADTAIGKKLYDIHCVACHGRDGEGFAIPGEEFSGYVYPPIAGEDSFNDGAGMNRVLTAAQFIKWNMPFGVTYRNPLLTDEEAYHIAAFINSLERPSKANREQDFPDKKLKPVSTPYGPWADDFPPEQHKYGPFPPIISYYKKKHDITKTK